MSDTEARPDALPDRRFRRAFWTLLIFGLTLRAIAAWYSVASVHADEHQQYLEQAQKLATGGPAVEYWEQERGMRNLFYPYVLAGLVVVADFFGVQDTVVQAALLRFALAAVGLALIAWYARRWAYQRRIVAALALLTLAALTPWAVFVQVRVLSENAMIIPLVAALLCLDRRPVWTGVWLAVMFTVRFQSAFLIAGFFLVAMWDDYRGGFKRPWHGRTGRMALGALVTVALTVGLLDRLTLGGWFHSPLENYQANIIENLSAGHGIHPWYAYLHWSGATLVTIAVVAPVLFLIGFIREWRLGLPALLMVAGHSAIAHKEPRFMWGTLPIVLILMASGFELLYRRFARKAVLVSACVAAFAVGAVLTFPLLPWRDESYRSSGLALNWIRRQPDVTGVVLYGADHWMCGNYFHLRRDVPYYYFEGVSSLDLTLAAAPDANYLIAPEKFADLIRSRGLREEARLGEFVVFRKPEGRGR